MPMINKKYLSEGLRIFVGLVFVASAILKYISIDIFDLYVFEHELFSISITETLTRLLVTAELTLGILLISNIHTRFAYYCVIFFLSGFTLYLFLLPYLFEVDTVNCQCFGNALVLSRGESIAKNLILLLCLVFVSPKCFTIKKWHKWFMIVSGIALFIAFMVINAPNYLYTIVHKDKIQIDVPVYESALGNSGNEAKFTDGKQIICFYSVRCKFCQRAAQKLHLILKRHQLSEDQVKVVFLSSTPDSLIALFFYNQKIPPIEYTTFRVDTFLRITSGSMPVLLFSDNGTIVQKANYVTLNEKEVVEFFRNE